MPLFKRNKEPDPPQRNMLMRGVREHPNAVVKKQAETFGSLSPDDFFQSLQGHGRLGSYGLGLWNESLYYAVYQVLVSPWLRTSAGVAILQKVCNMISSLPCAMRNKLTGEIRELPLVPWMYPLGNGNPSYQTPSMLEDAVSSMFRFGKWLATTTWNPRDECVGISTIDATRAQLNGSFRKPFWELHPGATSFGGHFDTQITGRIYPDGRPFGMLSVSWLRSPETNQGVPAAMLASPSVDAANRTDEYASNFYGDWQQQLIAPKTKDDMSQAQEHMELIEDQVEDNARVIISAIEVVIQKMGLSADDAQIVAARMADSGFLAAMHGFPISVINSDKASYAQVYADQQILRTDVAQPLGERIRRELTRLLPPPWEFWLDYEYLDRGDPRTQTEIANMRIKGGWWSVNRALTYAGEAPIGSLTDKKSPYNRPMVDGNRVFVDKLDEMAASKAGKQSTGSPPKDDKKPSPNYPKTKEQQK